MALFKGKDIEKIGPVRSSRHYFLDYAMENDAIYVHYGFSEQAKADIATLGVNNINGLYIESDLYNISLKSVIEMINFIKSASFEFNLKID